MCAEICYTVLRGENIVTYIFDRYLQEYTALGTAGGMFHFRDQILSGSPSHLFVLNCDTCCDFPLQEMLDFHESKGPNPHFTIVGTEVRKHLYFGAVDDDGACPKFLMFFFFV